MPAARQLPLFSAKRGRERKQAGLSLVEEHGKEWLTKARQVAIAIAEKQGTVTSDDVKAVLGEVPSYLHPNTAGAIFHGNLFVRVGYKQSERVLAHARVIAVWALRSFSEDNSSSPRPVGR